MNTPKIPCNHCGRKVKDIYQSKWDHVWKFHPDMVLSKMVGAFLRPQELERIGEKFGQILRNKLVS